MLEINNCRDKINIAQSGVEFDLTILKPIVNIKHSMYKKQATP